MRACIPGVFVSIRRPIDEFPAVVFAEAAARSRRYGGLLLVPNRRPAMPIRSSICGCSTVLALLAFFAVSALGQTPSSPPVSMEQEIEDLRAENAAVREQLKTLVDTVNKLQRRLDEGPATVVREFPSSTPPPTQPLTATPLVAESAIRTPSSKLAQTVSSQTPAANAALNTPPAVAQLASTSGQPESVPAPQI